MQLTPKNAPPPGSHVFQPTSIIFELVQNIIGVNLLIKFYEDRTINVTSRVKNALPLGSHVFQANTHLLTKFHEDWTINVASTVFTRKNGLPLGSHVFQANVTIFELIQYIIETNLPTKFQEDWTINVASRVLTRLYYSHTCIRKTATPPDINETNVMTTFFDDWAKIVTSRVFTRKTAPPTGGHVFQQTGTTFELKINICVF
ncbi:hypothetical protein DPMN_076078 [Dreissena polymorpha]|uniref:Uncharacterized protein n=1 Tax=Dreissena polymorpha TaxID=45954 RepID=A0A9D3YLR0_DREPO|nr:hypothetical protein DPMN_076078 [Dreissena polymorpha]